RPRAVLRGVAGVADRMLLRLGVAAPAHESSSLLSSWFNSANRLWPPGVTEGLAETLDGLLGMAGSSLKCRERRPMEPRLPRMRIRGPEGVLMSELNEGYSSSLEVDAVLSNA